MTPQKAARPPGLAALEGVLGAIEDGAGLPEVARLAARAANASLAVIDRASGVLAVAARSPTDERALMERSAGVEVLELRAAGRRVGELRVRPRGEAGADRLLLAVLRALLAGEVERVRAPERAAAEASAAFVLAVVRREVTDRGDIVARGRELGCDLAAGGSVLVVRAHPHATVEEHWRVRVRAIVERTARALARGGLAALAEREPLVGEVLVLLPGAAEDVPRRVADALAAELATGLPGFTFAVGRSRVAADPVDLHRAAREARLAANVAAADREQPVLAFDDTGAYRLLLSEDPAELQRFYSETVEPLVLYDEQYETELVHTLETFLDLNGNVAGSAQRLCTHRHTVRYRLERARELTGLDVGATEGRERLGLGLKAMRVLGIVAPGGPAREAGAAGGRVPRAGA